jgi:ribonuclease HI
VALNVDGTSYGNPGITGYGGLIRDHNGSWIIGFSGPVSFVDSLEVELLAIKN